MILKDQYKAHNIQFSVARRVENSVNLQSKTFSFSAFSLNQLTTGHNGDQLVSYRSTGLTKQPLQ